MSLSMLSAISPIDGRYRSKTDALAGFFSEESLIRYRVLVEIEYFIALCELPLPQLEAFDPALFEGFESHLHRIFLPEMRRLLRILKALQITM